MLLLVRLDLDLFSIRQVAPRVVSLGPWTLRMHFLVLRFPHLLDKEVEHVQFFVLFLDTLIVVVLVFFPRLGHIPLVVLGFLFLPGQAFLLSQEVQLFLVLLGKAFCLRLGMMHWVVQGFDLLETHVCLLEVLLVDALETHVFVLIQHRGHALVHIQCCVPWSVPSNIWWVSFTRVSLRPSIPCRRLKSSVNSSSKLQVLQVLKRTHILRLAILVRLGTKRLLAHLLPEHPLLFLICNSLHFLVNVLWFVAHHDADFVAFHVKVII